MHPVRRDSVTIEIKNFPCVAAAGRPQHLVVPLTPYSSSGSSRARIMVKDHRLPNAAVTTAESTTTTGRRDALNACQYFFRKLLFVVQGHRRAGREVVLHAFFGMVPAAATATGVGTDGRGGDVLVVVVLVVVVVVCSIRVAGAATSGAAGAAGITDVRFEVGIVVNGPGSCHRDPLFPVDVMDAVDIEGKERTLADGEGRPEPWDAPTQEVGEVETEEDPHEPEGEERGLDLDVLHVSSLQDAGKSVLCLVQKLIQSIKNEKENEREVK